jgi:hypothetical protein
MSRRSVGGVVVGAVAVVVGLWLGVRAQAKLSLEGPMIGHMVYFTLKDNSAGSKKKLVDACKKYLGNHEGTVYFSAGMVAEEFKREVNDRDWDVALHLVFKTKQAHDQYQDHARHKQFIDENKDNWKKVRVFDSLIE